MADLSDLSSSDDEAAPASAPHPALSGGPKAELTDEEVIDKAAEYFWSDAFTEEFEEFMTKRCDIFTDEEENKLEYTVVYQEYQALFDKCMTGFLESVDVSAERFHGICKEAMESRSGEDELGAKSFVNMMLASVDYAAFLQEMRRMAQERVQVPGHTWSSLSLDN